MESIVVDRTLDCSGSLCPMPVIRARKAIDELEPGQVLEVVATDPGARGDFPAFAKNTGHTLLGLEEEGPVIKVYLRKAGA